MLKGCVVVVLLLGCGLAWLAIVRALNLPLWANAAGAVAIGILVHRAMQD